MSGSPRRTDMARVTFPVATATAAETTTNMVVKIDLRPLYPIWHRACAKRAGVPTQTLPVEGGPFKCTGCGRAIAKRSSR